MTQFDIIECDNQKELIKKCLGSFVYVVLPFEDKTYIDSIFRTDDGEIIWKVFPDNPTSYYLCNHISDPLKKARNAFTKFDSKEKFFNAIPSQHKSDLEFFLWYPEVHNGRWFNNK